MNEDDITLENYKELLGDDLKGAICLDTKRFKYISVDKLIDLLLRKQREKFNKTVDIEIENFNIAASIDKKWDIEFQEWLAEASEILNQKLNSPITNN